MWYRSERAVVVLLAILVSVSYDILCICNRSLINGCIASHPWYVGYSDR
jgi:hypothetical protein